MTSRDPLIRWLRGLPRGGKFVILLIAAWAPVVMPSDPLMAGLTMVSATIAFFVATGSGSAAPPNPGEEEGHGGP